jgi:predicted Fe-Mo cluster-binding NifX family protein
MTKIAIPTKGGMVDEHFGHCESFTIVSVDEAKTVTGSESFTPPPQCGCKSDLIPTLLSMGVSVLVAGNMGEGAVMRLRQSGIQVFRGAAGPVDAAVAAYLAGNLADRDELCQHHGHECGHGH